MIVISHRKLIKFDENKEKSSTFVPANNRSFFIQ